MNPFAEYEKTDISNVVLNQDYFKSFEDSEDHLLLDMDSLVQRKNEDLLLSRIYNDPDLKKCSLGEEPDEIDGAKWSSKPIEDWSQEETINWLMMSANCFGQSYGSIQQSLALPGKELLGLSRRDFAERDPAYGERLYNLLHSQAVASQCKSDMAGYFGPRRAEDFTGDITAETFQKLCQVEEPRGGSNNASDAESDNSVEISTKRPPGRPRLLKTKKNLTR